MILNKGKYGLSTLVLGQKMNVTTVTSNKIIQRLGALNREGMGYILGPYAPKYPYKVTVVSGYNALSAPDLPDVDCSNSAKVMPAAALLKPDQPLYVEKSPLENKFYFDEATQKVKIKRGFPVLDNFAQQSESACAALVQQILYLAGQQDCPHCATATNSAPSAAYQRCKRCAKKYNWRTNTVFMHSKLPVKAILAIMAKLYNFRLSLSSYSIARELGITRNPPISTLKRFGWPCITTGSMRKPKPN